MRDFTNGGDINGDVVINDNSVEYKPLDQCTNEELYHEEKHRRMILNNETSRKNGFFIKFILFSVGLCVLAYVWFQVNGSHSLASTILGLIGVMCGFVTLSQANTQTDFERRQRATLREINMLLRERGVR